jgi:hypothetical protein
MKKILSLIVATFLFVAFSHAQSTNLVSNGGFDTISDWTLSNLAYFNVKNGEPAPDVVLQGTSSLALQPLNLTAGITYTISGNYYPNIYNFGDLRIGFNSGIVYEISLPTNNATWSSFSFQYTVPPSPTHLILTLSFKGIGGCEIDNIGVYAVPEPHYISFGILILIMIIAIWYIRNTNKW